MRLSGNTRVISVVTSVIKPFCDDWYGWQRQTWHSALIQIFVASKRKTTQFHANTIQNETRSYRSCDHLINGEIIIIWPVHIHTQTLYTGNANFYQPCGLFEVQNAISDLLVYAPAINKTFGDLFSARWGARNTYLWIRALHKLLAARKAKKISSTLKAKGHNNSRFGTWGGGGWISATLCFICLWKKCENRSNEDDHLEHVFDNLTKYQFRLTLSIEYSHVNPSARQRLKDTQSLLILSLAQYIACTDTDDCCHTGQANLSSMRSSAARRTRHDQSSPSPFFPFFPSCSSPSLNNKTT